MNNIMGLYNPLSILYNSTFNLLWGKSYSKSSCLIKKPSSDFLKDINLIIFDMDGVLRIGKNPIELAKHSFNNLVKTEIPICIITNECRRTPKTITKELKNMGYNIDNNIKLFSAGQLMFTKLCQIIDCNLRKTHPKKLGFGIISDQPFNQYITQNIYNKYGKIVNFYWIYDKIRPNNIDYFVVGCLNNQDVETSQKKIERFNSWVNMNITANFLLTCPDTKDVENMEVLSNFTPRIIIKLIIKKQLEMQNTFKNDDDIQNSISLVNHINNHIEIPSKPNIELFRNEIEQHYGTLFNNKNSKNPIVMIGDNVKTDIRFANNLNIYSCLVLSGVTKYDDLKKILSKNKDNIDFIIPDISYL